MAVGTGGQWFLFLGAVGVVRRWLEPFAGASRPAAADDACTVIG
jgi:hypothetical protein